MTREVLILTGPPGAGKSTVAPLVADRWDPGALIRSDWFWMMIRRGYHEPWTTEAHGQNRVVLRAFSAAAATLAAGGYPVVLEGVIGPWNLDVVTDELTSRPGGTPALHYVVLRPRLEVAVRRAVERDDVDLGVPERPALTAEGPVRALWEQFASLGPYERHAVDHSDLTPEESAARIWRLVESRSNVL